MNTEDSFFESSFKILSYYQIEIYKNFFLINLKNKIRLLDEIISDKNTLIRLENCINFVIADIYYFNNSHLLNSSDSNIDNYIDKDIFCEKVFSSIRFDKKFYINYKKWESLFYINPILSSILTQKKFVTPEIEDQKIIELKVNYLNIFDKLESIISNSYNKKNTVKVLIKMTSIFILMINNDINNYGFLIENSKEENLKYVIKFNLELSNYIFFIQIKRSYERFICICKE